MSFTATFSIHFRCSSVQYSKCLDTELKDDDIFVYIEHLKNLYNDMQFRFSDLLEMTIPDWVVDPFQVNAVDIDSVLQEYLIELQSDVTAQARFKNDKQHF